jgi:FixJ family two-component response regulator
MNDQPCVFIVDDDYAVRDSLELIIEGAGLTCQTFESAEKFLNNYCLGHPGCLLLDVNMPNIDGCELQAEMNRRKINLPIIFISAYANIPTVVQTMKAGAVDFLSKPVERLELIGRIQAVLQHETEVHNQDIIQQALGNRFNNLTNRELQVLPLALSGIPNKLIGRQLGISFRTIELHRQRILHKTGATNFLELAKEYEDYLLSRFKYENPD